MTTNTGKGVEKVDGEVFFLSKKSLNAKENKQNSTKGHYSPGYQYLHSVSSSKNSLGRLVYVSSIT